MIRTITHDKPIFLKFELNCTDFLSKLETKGLIPIALEEGSMVFRLRQKTELITFHIDADIPRPI